MQKSDHFGYIQRKEVSQMAQKDEWPADTLCARCPRTWANHHTEAASHHEFSPAQRLPVDKIDDNFNG